MNHDNVQCPLQMMYQAEELVDVLLSTKAHHYLEFKAVEARYDLQVLAAAVLDLCFLGYPMPVPFILFCATMPPQLHPSRWQAPLNPSLTWRHLQRQGPVAQRQAQPDDIPGCMYGGG